MPYMSFNAQVWKQGNSLLITVPKEVRDMYFINEGDVLQIQAGIIDKKKMEEIREESRSKARYQHEASGVIKHKAEDIAILEKVFISEIKFRAGALGEGQSFDNLPEITSFVGVIFRGRFLPNIFNTKHYGEAGVTEQMGYYLTGNEIMELVLETGNRLILSDLSFENPLMSNKGLQIKNVGFDSRPNFTKK